MAHAALSEMFTQEYLDTLLPRDISDRFFEALYGDASDGAYDIQLEFISANDKRIVLAFNLVQRKGKCLVCSLTYGLPNVFTRHPLINVKGMVKKIEEKGIRIKSWRMGETEENNSALHIIPFYLYLE
jgi:hypothetical protein